MEGSIAMSRSQRRLHALTLAGLAAITALTASAAYAQFGYTLPKNDFVWNWGRNPEGLNTKFEDFSIHGSEAGFQCELIGKAGLSGRFSQSDIRQLEETLRARMDFIYAVSTYMNDLDRQNLIDWARLSCDKQEAKELTEDEKAAREARAKEKMQREIDRRRAREHE
jgi:hypothetical protein